MSRVIGVGEGSVKEGGVIQNDNHVTVWHDQGLCQAARARLRQMKKVMKT